MRNLLRALTIPLAFALLPSLSFAQQPTASEPTEEEQRTREENKKRALGLLDQVVNESQMLRLGENRVRVQIHAADMLWSQNEGRARSLFSMAADSIAEMQRTNQISEQNRRRGFRNASLQLRQELILTVAQHDAPLAYQLLAVTKQAVTDPRDERAFAENELEQRLLAQVAALDPKTALQTAEQQLDRNEISRSLWEVLANLQRKDKEAAQRLEEKLVKKLLSANWMTSPEPGGLAFNLLLPGPKVGDSLSSSRPPLLAQSAYVDVMNALIDTVLKATPSANIQRRGGARGRQVQAPTTSPATANDAQTEQTTARWLASTMRPLLPMIDQYVPSRAPAVRQKLTELGFGNNTMAGTFAQLSTAQTIDSDALLAAAASAPPLVQQRMYQQAATRALEEGKTEKAKEIANNHLEANVRDSFLRRIEFRELADKSEIDSVDDVRATLAVLPSDTERISLLLRLADTNSTKNSELALKLAEEARQYTNRRATNYQMFEEQLRVAAAFRKLGHARGFEVLEPGIIQLNELLSAAAVLSGFEVSVFRDGEIPMQGGSGLVDMMRRFAQEIGRFAEIDLERAQALANRFQFTEARIGVRLFMARSLLGLDGTRIGLGTPPRFGRGQVFRDLNGRDQ